MTDPMSVIAERPLVVMWSMRGLLYAMMEVTAADMKRIHDKGPDVEGIPTYYAIEDDDVQWWPSCKEDEPVLGYDRG